MTVACAAAPNSPQQCERCGVPLANTIFGIERCEDCFAVDQILTGAGGRTVLSRRCSVPDDLVREFLFGVDGEPISKDEELFFADFN